MRTSTLAFAVVVAVGLLGCGDDGDGGFRPVTCGDLGAATCVEIPAGDSAALLDAVNALEDDTTVLLAAGTYRLDNQVTIRADQINLVGAGMEDTILDFSPAASQINGVDTQGDDFLVQDLTVIDAPKDGIRVENSDGVTYRRIKTTWSTPEDSTNGAYGIYPVRCQNVLIEDSVAENASDAGLYVGQSQFVIVRNNIVRGNVAALEIENTQYADVYDNLATGNTGGVVVFDLPGNPIVGRDVRLRDNTIVDNNLPNFAPGGTVAIIPAGSGTFAMASRRVEITGNTYRNNQTFDIALISGDVIGNANWELDTDTLVGDWEDLDLPAGETEGTIVNITSTDIVVANNSHEGSGLSPDPSKEFGLLFAALYHGGGDRGVTPSVVYDTIGESAFDAEVPENNSNDNRLCVGGNTAGDGFGSMDLLTQLEENLRAPHLVIDDAPFAPFDCTEIASGPVEDVELQ